MSWSTQYHDICMTQGDFGVPLLMTFCGPFILEDDELRFTIKKNDKFILGKTFTKVRDNRLEFSLTEEESSLLEPDLYEYSLEWYRDNSFRSSIIPSASFRVIERA